MPLFPSLEWFQALAERMNTVDREVYEHLGEADVRWCIRFKRDPLARAQFLYGFEFEEFGCTNVVELDPKSDASDFDPDFILESRYVVWADVLHNSMKHDGADLHHTLNILSINDDPVHIEAADQMRADKFFRYGQTFQEFIDAGRHIETEWLKELPEGGLAELVEQVEKHGRKALRGDEG